MEDNLRNLVDANRTDISKINKDISDLQNCVTQLYNNQKVLESTQNKLSACCAIGFLSSSIGMLALLFGYIDCASESNNKISVEKHYYINEHVTTKEETIEEIKDDVK